MSFTLRRSLIAARPAFQPRSFLSTSPVAFKTVTETVQDAAAKVNRAAGDAALKGIDLGEAATATVQETVKPVIDKVKSATSSKDAAKSELDKATKEGSKKAEDLKTEATKAGKDVKNKAEKVATDIKGEFNKATK